MHWYEITLSNGSKIDRRAASIPLAILSVDMDEFPGCRIIKVEEFS